MVMKNKTNDPQVVVSGSVKQGRAGGEIITFSLRLSLIELVFIVPIPEDENQLTVPIYVKHKVRWPSQERAGDQLSRHNDRQNDDYEGPQIVAGE